jgi:hypothetical protein
VQPLTGPPREAFTEDDVLAIVRDAPALIVSSGLELLDQGLNVLVDLTTYLTGGEVSRASYADLHGSANLLLETELDWGTAIVRPFMNLTDGVTLLRFNLGAYYTSSPTIEVEASPVLHTVIGIDIIDGLNDPLGETYVVDKGESYLDTVEQIFLQRGFTAYSIDWSAVDSVLPSPKVWLLDDHTTWLNVVNELLGGVGYQGVWSDWDGALRAQRYISPSLRASEFEYDVSEMTGMMEESRSIELDFYKVPNRWVFFRTNTTEGFTPIEGNGVYTFVNQADGPTSVTGRGGRVITKTLGIDAVDQAALVASGTVTIDADSTTNAKMTLHTSPNPLHWHFDRVTVDDPAMGITQDALTTQWTLPLNGEPMSHEWTIL